MSQNLGQLKLSDGRDCYNLLGILFYEGGASMKMDNIHFSSLDEWGFRLTLSELDCADFHFWFRWITPVLLEDLMG